MNNTLRPKTVIVVATIAVAVPIYALVLTALAWRLTARVRSAWDLPTLPLRAAAWMTAFALYLWRFAPLLIRPRGMNRSARFLQLLLESPPCA